MVTVGIVGGVGPEASNKFCDLLIKNKKKGKDQDNIPFIHFSNCKIPDRTQYILGIGSDPTPMLIDTSQKLESIGADFLVIPCNTAHYFLNSIKENVNIPVVDMIGLTVKDIKQRNASITKVGVLATTGTIKTGLFHNYLISMGIDPITLNDIDQETLVMEAIYGLKGIKSGYKEHPRKLLEIAVSKLIGLGAQEIILGCTELPLVLNQDLFQIKLNDPMEITVNKIIKYYESLENDNILFENILSVMEEVEK